MLPQCIHVVEAVFNCLLSPNIPTLNSAHAGPLHPPLSYLNPFPSTILLFILFPITHPAYHIFPFFTLFPPSNTPFPIYFMYLSHMHMHTLSLSLSHTHHPFPHVFVLHIFSPPHITIRIEQHQAVALDPSRSHHHPSLFTYNPYVNNNVIMYTVHDNSLHCRYTTTQQSQ